MGFAAIDFELANAKPTSACALGVALFSDKGLKKRYKWLLRPPYGSGEFMPYNQKIHGISEEMVWDAPAFYDIWETLCPILGGQTLIAHNAPFDAGILRKLCEYFGLNMEPYHYICTCQIAKKLWTDMPNHKLSTVSWALDLPLDHHDPESDAEASGYIMLRAMSELRVRKPETAARLLGVKIGTLEPLDGCKFT